MADITLSSKSTTTIIVGGYVYIIIPDGGSPTGFVGRRISVTNLLAALQADVDTNTSNITSNTARIVIQENLNSVATYTNEVSNFQFSQPANSIINRFRLRSTGAATCTITGSVYGAIKTVSLSDGELYDLSKMIDSVVGQTITFTITGTVSAEIYYNKNTI